MEESSKQLEVKMAYIPVPVEYCPIIKQALHIASKEIGLGDTTMQMVLIQTIHSLDGVMQQIEEPTPDTQKPTPSSEGGMKDKPLQPDKTD